MNKNSIFIYTSVNIIINEVKVFCGLTQFLTEGTFINSQTYIEQIQKSSMPARTKLAIMLTQLSVSAVASLIVKCKISEQKPHSRS